MPFLLSFIGNLVVSILVSVRLKKEKINKNLEYLISRLLAIPIFFFMSWIFLNVLTVIHIFNDLNIHLMTFAVSINFLSPIANTSIFF